MKNMSSAESQNGTVCSKTLSFLKWINQISPQNLIRLQSATLT